MSANALQISLSQDIGAYVRHELRRRRGLIMASVVLSAAALWFGWPWLVAAGIAPLLVVLAPCAIMCGLGFRISRACSRQEEANTTRSAANSTLQQAAVTTEPATVSPAPTSEAVKWEPQGKTAGRDLPAEAVRQELHQERLTELSCGKNCRHS